MCRPFLQAQSLVTGLGGVPAGNTGLPKTAARSCADTLLRVSKLGRRHECGKPALHLS